MRVAISGTGLFTPAESISNTELVAAYNEFVRRHNAANPDGTHLLKSSDEFIVKASGIRSRHVLAKQGMLDPEIMCPRLRQRANEELSYSAEIGIAAARQALEAARRTPQEIDGVIVAASIMERPYPQIAIEIQDALGIRGFGFDMLAGCSSATYGLQTAADAVAQGRARAVLAVNPEICTSHLNLRDRETHFIFGDAATACIVEQTEKTSGRNCWEIVGTRLKSVFSNNIRNNFGPMNRFDPETMGLPDKLITQKGRKVFKEVVPMVSEMILSHMAELQLQPGDLRRLWLHQANSNMNRLIAERVLGREATQDEAPTVLDTYGNTAGAGSIVAFHHHSADLKPGDKGLICSFGAGYSAGTVFVAKAA